MQKARGYPRVCPDAGQEAIVMHTYCPKESHIPLHGQLVINEAVRLAQSKSIPIIIAVGRTVPTDQRTEAEIYRDAIVAQLDAPPVIVVGQNRQVRDTAGEVREAVRILRNENMASIYVFALRPHLPRVEYWWDYYGTIIHPTFVAVEGPLQYFLWEFMMYGAEKLLPPGSKRRQFVLDMIGRKG